MKHCVHCNVKIDDVNDSCWDCYVEQSRITDEKKLLPNGLPVTCIKADGTMLECEHGDHPDYKFPVRASYVGPMLPEIIEEASFILGHRASEEEARAMRQETHALIYTDGCVALTMSECCYALWHVAGDGNIISGNLWQKDCWRLTSKSVEECVELARKEGKKR